MAKHPAWKHRLIFLEEDIIPQALADGFKVERHSSGAISIYKKRGTVITRGLRVFPDGTGYDMSVVDVSLQRALKSLDAWIQVLGWM